MSELSFRDETVNAGADFSPVSVIGLGNMGLALAGAFLNGGYPTTVWNRSIEKTESLVANGAHRASSFADAFSASDIVVVCLSTYEVMHELLATLSQDLSGKTIINLTTGTPEEARKTAKWAAERGVDYLDGAIMAIPQMIGLPETLIFYGGSASVFEAHKPLLTLLGGNTTYLSSDPGVPLIYDMGLLTMMYGAWYGYLHAHAMLSAANISASEFLPYVTNWFQHLIVPMLTDPIAARELDEGIYTTDVSNMAVNMQALNNIVRSSNELVIPADWLIPIQALAAQKVAEGYGASAFTRVYEAIRKN